MYASTCIMIIYIICYRYTWCYRRCRKKERKTPEAMEKWKMIFASGGIQTHETLYVHIEYAWGLLLKYNR